MKVILFDIDGTLILTQNAGQRAMEQAIADGRAAQSKVNIDYAGRTDRSIVADHLKQHGLEDTQENFQRYSQDFLTRLPQSLHDRDGHVLPGVFETLERLTASFGIQLGLLTGNLRRAARIKLQHFGLDQFFYTQDEAVGGFGDRHYERDDVARDALDEVRQRISADIQPDQVWIVGDTPRDVQCARAIGANVLAVATGSYTEQQLQATDPDLLAADLRQAESWWVRLGL